MNSKLIFENSEPIDVRAFTLMGLSVKSSTSAIGQFGTGLKYAIAVCLRKGLDIRIRSNGVCHSFFTKQSTFRGKEFSMIMWHTSDSPDSSIPLPFTLDYGLNWDLWMAYRELSSNCMDESGIERIVSSSYSPFTLGTCIEVTGDDILDLHRSRHEYFLTSPALATTKTFEIHEKRSNGLFYKGVRVGEDLTTNFTYNVRDNVTLTEDRTILSKDIYSREVVRGVVQLTDRSILTRILSHRKSKGSFESELNYAYIYENHHVSDEFLDCAEARIKSEPVELPYGLKQLLKSRGRLKEENKIYIPSALELKKIYTIKQMLAKVNIEVPTINYIHTTKESLHGYFDPKTPDCIYITNFGIAQGMHELAQTIYEETNHCNGNYDDCSRAYQDFLQRTIINFISEKTETLL